MVKSSRIPTASKNSDKEKESRLIEIIRHYVVVYGIEPELRSRLSAVAPELLESQAESLENPVKILDWPTYTPDLPQVLPSQGSLHSLDCQQELQTVEGNAGSQSIDDVTQSAASLAEMPFYPSDGADCTFFDEQFEAIMRESQENGFLSWDAASFDAREPSPRVP